nr:MAG TPA: hypothetical protein [Caudoviricetes sp.]
MDKNLKKMLKREGTYIVNYHTGAGNFIITGTLEEAIKEAEEGTCYTQKPVTIELEGEYDEFYPIVILPWHNGEPSKNKPVVAQFGDFGYYGTWEVVE